MSCFVGGQKQACFSSWETGFGLTVACFAFIASMLRIHARIFQDVLLALAFLACGGHHILLRLLSLHLCNEYLSLPKKNKKKKACPSADSTSGKPALAADSIPKAWYPESWGVSLSPSSVALAGLRPDLSSGQPGWPPQGVTDSTGHSGSNGNKLSNSTQRSNPGRFYQSCQQ